MSTILENAEAEATKGYEALMAMEQAQQTAPEPTITVPAPDPVENTATAAPDPIIETPAVTDGNTPVNDAPTTPIETPATPSEIETLRQHLEAEKQATAKAEEKYRVLQGKEYAEVPRLAKRVKELEAEKQAILDAQANAAPVDLDAAIEQYGLDPAIKDFDPVIAESMIKIARANAAKAAPATDNTDIQQVRDDLFFAKLEAKVPDWDDLVDNNPQFKVWGNTPDPIHGLTPMQTISAARNRLDDKAAIKVFNAFKATQAAPTNGNGNPKPSAPAPSITPAAAPVAQAAQPKPKTLTFAEITQMSTDLNRGVYSGAEADRVRKEIDAASRVLVGT